MAEYKANSNDARKYFIDACMELYGDKCAICNTPGEALRKDHSHYDEYRLEHINNNKKDYRFKNIRIVCHSCNGRKGKAENAPGASTEKELTENEVRSAVEAAISEDNVESKASQRRKRKHFQNAPPEMQKTIIAEPKIRRYLWMQVNRTGGFLWDDAKAEAAEFAECDVQTAERKMLKATSKAGPFDTKLTPGGEEIIILRNGYKPNIGTEMGVLDWEMMQERIKMEQQEKDMIKQESEQKVQKISADLHEQKSTHENFMERFKYMGIQRDAARDLLMKNLKINRDEADKLIDATVVEMKFGKKVEGDQPPSHGARKDIGDSKSDDDSRPGVS